MLYCQFVYFGYVPPNCVLITVEMNRKFGLPLALKMCNPATFMKKFETSNNKIPLTI